MQQVDYTYQKQCNGPRLTDELLAYAPIKSALTSWTETSGGLPVAPITVFTTQTTTTVRCPENVAESDVAFVVDAHVLNPPPPPPPPPPPGPTELSPTIITKVENVQAVTTDEQAQINKHVLEQIGTIPTP